MSYTKKKHISVCLRVRPPNTKESNSGDFLNVVEVDPMHAQRIRLRKESSQDEPKEYTFNSVFPSTVTQREVYETCAQAAVDDALSGYQGLVFVYGQTGTGKTHTLCNIQPGSEGILHRSVNDLFRKIDLDTANTYEVKISFVQIYSEVVEDLLSDLPDSVVNLREDPSNPSAVELKGCNYVTIRSAQEALATFKRGDSQRAVGDTSMNDKSSRSHCIFTLYVTKKPKMTDSMYENTDMALETRGRLTLVDLAGSERAKKAGTDALGREERLKEATFINKSLLTLGRVVHILTEGVNTHVPYRDSKLTRLLQYSLSGKGRTTIIVTVGPSASNYEETYNAIQFGQRAAKIQEDALQDQVIDWKAMALKYLALYEQGTDIAVKTALEAERVEHDCVVRQLKGQIEELKGLLVTSSTPRTLEVVRMQNQQTTASDLAAALAKTRQSVEECARYKAEVKLLSQKMESLRSDTEKMFQETDQENAALRERISDMEGKSSVPADLIQEVRMLREANGNMKAQLRKKDRALLKLRDERTFSGFSPVNIIDPKSLDLSDFSWNPTDSMENKLKAAVVILHHEKTYLLQRLSEVQKDCERYRINSEKFKDFLKKRTTDAAKALSACADESDT